MRVLVLGSCAVVSAALFSTGCAADNQQESSGAGGGGSSGSSGQGGSGGGGGSAGAPAPALDLDVEEVRATSEPILDLIALDDGRIGVITLNPGDPTAPTCPDCEGMKLDEQCPAQCRRDILRFAVLGPGGEPESAPKTLRSYALPSLAHGFGLVDGAALSSDAVALAWQLCENPPSRSCTVEYTVVAKDGTPAFEPVTLYEHLYGDIRIAANRELQQVLLVRTTVLDVRAGVDATIVDNAGMTVLDWTRLGTSRARWAAPAASASGFLVAMEERFPGTTESGCPPCETLVPDCVALPPGCAQGEIEPEAGIYAYTVNAAGVAGREKVGTGWSDDGVYQDPSYVSAHAAARPVVCEWSFGDRSYDVFARGDGWKTPSTAPNDKAPGWTSVFGADDNSAVWLAGVASLGPALADTRTVFVGGLVSSDGSSVTATTIESVTGFSFAGTAAFEGPGSAVVAAGVLGLTSDASGYDHYSIVRVRWNPQAVGR